MEWKWSKDPKPNELNKLLPRIRDGAYKTLKQYGPHIGRWIVRRIRTQGLIAEAGRTRPIPPYSKNYQGVLKKLGESTRPDLTFTEVLLDHLRGRIRVQNVETVELRISPYGQASQPGRTYQKGKIGRKGTEREGYWYRQPYSYFDSRRNATIDVPGSWIKYVPTIGKKKYKPKKILYNAHLATYLSYRLGGGRWKAGGMPPSSFLTLTDTEHKNVAKLMSVGHQKVGKEVIAKVAGH